LGLGVVRFGKTIGAAERFGVGVRVITSKPASSSSCCCNLSFWVDWSEFGADVGESGCGGVVVEKGREGREWRGEGFGDIFLD